MTMRQPILALLGLSALLLASGPATAALGAGTPAPAFKTSSLGKENTPHALSDWQGKVVYLDFWASWCGPCRQSFPALDRLYGQYRETGLVVVGVNQDDQAGDADRFLARTPASFPLIRDKDHRIAEAYAVAGMPSAVLIDRKGVVRYIHRGFRAGDEQALEDWIKRLLGES